MAKEYKECSKCGIPQRISEFHLDKRKSDGRIASCKDCSADYRKIYYETSKAELPDRREYYKKYTTTWRNLSEAERAERKIEKQEQLLNRVAQRIELYKQQEIVRQEVALQKAIERKIAADKRAVKAKYRRENSKQIANERYKHRYKTDPIFKLKELFRSRLSKVFKRNGYATPKRCYALLGTDFETAKAYIENQFDLGMRWDNHGLWHIDHQMPLASATTLSEIRKLFHYKNLQPLWAEDNISKHCKLPNQNTV